MIGDRLVITKRHLDITENLFAAIVKKYVDERLVIAIGGESGTGKSEVASCLQHKLYKEKKLRGKIIHLDDYFNVNWQDRNTSRKKKGIDSVGIREINWSKLRRVVKIFKRGIGKLYVQRIHMFTNSIEYVITSNKNIDILIVEGLYANHLKRKDIGIYLEGSIEETYKFRKERGKENPDDEFRQKILKKESKEIKQTKLNSDIIVNWEGAIK